MNLTISTTTLANEMTTLLNNRLPLPKSVLTGLLLFTFVVAVPDQSERCYGGVISSLVVEDSKLRLEVFWVGIGRLDDGQNNDSMENPQLNNWSIPTNPIKLTYLGGGDGWTGFFDVFHSTAPHAGEGVGGTVRFNLAFGQINPTRVFARTMTGHGGHDNFYRFDYAYTPMQDAFRAHLVGIHSVPEPTSLTIFGIGALGLVAGGIRRRRQKT